MGLKLSSHPLIGSQLVEWKLSNPPSGGSKLAELKLNNRLTCQGPPLLLLPLLRLLLLGQDNLDRTGCLETSSEGCCNSLSQKAKGCLLCSPLDWVYACWACQAWGCLTFPPADSLNAG